MINWLSRQLAIQKPTDWIIPAALIVVAAIRLALAASVPVETADALRNLGYGMHAFDDSFSIYETVARDFFPELWSILWRDLHYFYPPVTLIFFWGFSLFGAGIFHVKIVLTLLELVCAGILYRRVSALAALLYFCAPDSIFFASHEGQFEPLQSLTIMFAVLAIKDRRWLLGGLLWAISIQTKHFGVLLVPWIAALIWNERASGLAPRTAGRLLIGAILGALPFVPYYIQTPDLYFRALHGNQTGATVNFFAWNVFDRSLFGSIPRFMVIYYAIVTGATVILLLWWAVASARRRELFAALLPLLLFWVVMKSMPWVMPWYVLIAPAFMLCFAERRRFVELLLLLHLLMGIHSVAVFAGASQSYSPALTGPYAQVLKRCMYKGPPRYDGPPVSPEGANSNTR